MQSRIIRDGDSVTLEYYPPMSITFPSRDIGAKIREVFIKPATKWDGTTCLSCMTDGITRGPLIICPKCNHAKMG